MRTTNTVCPHRRWCRPLRNSHFHGIDKRRRFCPALDFRYRWNSLSSRLPLAPAVAPDWILSKSTTFPGLSTAPIYFDCRFSRRNSCWWYPVKYGDSHFPLLGLPSLLAKKVKFMVFMVLLKKFGLLYQIFAWFCKNASKFLKRSTNSHEFSQKCTNFSQNSLRFY